MMISILNKTTTHF